MKKMLICAAAMSVMASAAFAANAPTAPGNPDPKIVQSGNYLVEPSHTRVKFSVDHMGFTDWYGDFASVEGKLALDARDLAASKFDITVPVGSISTTNAKLDGELKSDAWLDAAKYPTIHFTSSSVVQTGPTTAKVTGQFTFHGVTRPLTLNAKLNGSGVNPLSKAYTVGFNLEGQLKRSAFGIGTYIPLIGDDVHIQISAAFEKAAN